ncbi:MULTISPECIES: hypothetical protein [unclassified Shewanella]|uniref:hypothetical protein n=1 Tax=unclassified Shewanella TaxID=196818 RepID=UPI001C819B58|nr:MULTISPECIES: hypothetical protein [unclassified Shewanella]MCG9728479.1 hypothetical protein [Shewanella sp. Isolate13]
MSKSHDSTRRQPDHGKQHSAEFEHKKKLGQNPNELHVPKPKKDQHEYHESPEE